MKFLTRTSVHGVSKKLILLIQQAKIFMTRQTLESDGQIVVFGIVLTINYPLYYLMWLYASQQSYENLPLRLSASFFCSLLIIKNYWPTFLRKFLPIYWYATVIYVLPFFFTFMLLKNQASTLWLMNTVSVLFFLLLLFDVISAIVLLLIGCLFGFVFYFLTTNVPFTFNPGEVNASGIIATLFAAFIIGALFARSRALLHRERLRTASMISASVAHDIRSPLASLLMIIKSCSSLPETERVALREAATSIGDIANNLLSKYKEKDSYITDTDDERQPVLLSAILLQTLTDKKFQYGELPIKFDYDFSREGQFAFILVDPTSLKRMLSNLINNAVDAREQHEGIIILKLEATIDRVKITIIDNGKGMSAELIAKIMKKIAITEGKEHGHGIGLAQVRETLEHNDGTLSIQSQVGQGAQIILEFPRIKVPDWIAEEIRLGTQDLVIILDDDSSIHLAWDTRFEPILAQVPEIRIRHFEICQEAINFINSLNEEDHKKIFLLTDFELLMQDLNGLHVVEKANVARSVLVTSHYVNAIVRERSIKMGTKILPKQLAPEVPINIDEMITYTNETQKDDEGLKIVDLILVDDNKNFAQTLIDFVFDQDIVDYYSDPRQLLENITQYPKDTRIYLDNNFTMVDTQGVEIAKDLHERGFTRLYLLSGDVFKPGEVPSYLTVIIKTQIDSIRDW